MSHGDAWTNPAATHADDSESIGEQIDRAIGEFDARLERLKEELGHKHSEIKQIEKLITETQKQQAKAFKELLQANPLARKMLSNRSKVKSAGRRRKSAGDQTEAPDPDAIF